MFKVGNQIIIKETGLQGWIYDDNFMSCDHYIVAWVENYIQHVQLLSEDSIMLKPCHLGKDGVCDYTCPHKSEGQFACFRCELSRMKDS